MLYLRLGETKTSYVLRSDQSLLEWEFSHLEPHSHWFKGGRTFSYRLSCCKESPTSTPSLHAQFNVYFFPFFSLPVIPPPHCHHSLSCFSFSGLATALALYPRRGTEIPLIFLTTHSTSSRCILWWTRLCPPLLTGPGSSRPWSGTYYTLQRPSSSEVYEPLQLRTIITWSAALRVGLIKTP